MYLDLAFCIKRLGDTMDWNMIQKELDKLELKQFFYLTLQSLHRWFGISIPISVPKVEESLLEAFSDFTMESGVFGFEGRKSGEQLVRKQSGKGKTGLRKKALKKILFPSANVLQNRYTYLKAYPWLLPFAWLDRLFRNYRKIGRMAEETKEIIAMKDEEIQGKNAFYRSIGL